LNLTNKFSNEVADLQSKTVDLGSDSVLATAAEVVAPRVTRDLVSPAHTPDDDIPLRILRKNIKIKKGLVKFHTVSLMFCNLNDLFSCIVDFL